MHYLKVARRVFLNIYLLCTVVVVGLPTLEELEEDLHLVGVLLEAADQGVVPHDRFQHVGQRVVLEQAVLVVGRGQHPLVQHLERGGNMKEIFEHEGVSKRDSNSHLLW